MKLQIEKGIPIPPMQLNNYMRQYGKILGRRYKSIYPFADMEVGDSFLIPKSMSRDKFRKLANVYGIKHNMKLVVLMDDNYQIRVWRIE